MLEKRSNSEEQTPKSKTEEKLQHNAVHELFEEWVEKSPNALALIVKETQLTYQTLNERANQLARVIKSHYSQHTDESVSSNPLIGVYMDRTAEMIISLLAIMKAGAAYVPISPDYPKDRVSYFLEDTQMRLLISQTLYKERLGEMANDASQAVEVLCADDSALFSGVERTNLESSVGPKDLAYVIYTSGTTGKPKGVMMEQLTFLDFVVGRKPQMNNAPVTMLSLTNFTFDIFGLEYTAPLLSGGTLVLSDIRSVHDELESVIDRVNWIQQTPATWRLFLRQRNPNLDLSKIQIIIGGESGSAELFESLNKVFDMVHHVYGPTETCIWSTTRIYETGKEKCIGWPMTGETVYVLNKDGEQVKSGEPGDLYIGGIGLARGYWNLPELTNERFVKNPFATASELERGYDRMYKTGDLVFALPDGSLEFIGRGDSQVKIRGHRIELSAIETILNAVPEVNEALVLAFEKKEEKFIAAYVQMANDSEFSSEWLNEQVGLKLPEYMIPAVFIQMDTFPLTTNGKLDRHALPKPEFNASENYVAPRNEVEEKLCEIWQEVLELDQVGIHDNFFWLGGNSIDAIMMSTISRRILQKDIPISLLFEYKTIAELAINIDQQEMLVIPKADKTVSSPLSFAQERLLFIEQFEQGTDAYHLPYLVELYPDTNIEALTAALDLVIERHTVLRTVFRQNEKGENEQLVLDAKVPLVKQELKDKNELDLAVKAGIAQPFDLTAEPSIRINLYELATSKYLMVLCHHIAFDGWSIDVFINEINEAYRALNNGQTVNLPALEITYSDYAAWQKERMQGEYLNSLTKYWSDQLSGYQTLNLQTDFSRPSQLDYQGKDLPIVLDEKLSAQLRKVAKDQETTLYTVLLSGFYVTLATLSGQSDVLIGTPSDNRSHAQIQSLIGFFVNTLPLRLDIQPNHSVKALIQQVHEVLGELKMHQELPFEKLIDALKVERDASFHPLFQVIFSLQGFGEKKEGLPFDPANLTETESIYTPARFDLSLLLTDGMSEIKGVLNYATSLFEEDTIERISAIYQKVLAAFAQDVEQPFANIDRLSESEKENLLGHWNDTSAYYPQDLTLQELFETQVATNPDKIAVFHEGKQLTYAELNQKANQLAHTIRTQYEERYQKALTPDTFIAIYLDRSVDLMVSILAVLKAGAAYVPISPQYPQARTSFILEDTNASIMLLQQEAMIGIVMENWLSELPEMPLLLLADDSTVTSGAPVTNPELINKSEDLAYVIYTSGTTGKPKGVMVDHRGVVSFVYKNAYVSEQAERVASLSPYSFDGFVFDAFYSLMNGASVFLVNKSLSLSTEQLCNYLTKHEIDTFFTTTALFNQLVRGGDLKNTKVRQLLFGGEKADVPVIQKALAELTEIKIIHVYGPTETVVYASAYHFGTETENAPIGSPLKNKKFYVLDQLGNPVPVGSLGELYIGGAGIARGYLNRPELTEERFVADPFASETDLADGCSRMYKTGDLVRWLPCGNIEFVGRIDKQVKIRGHRIELGEIENVLRTLPEVKEAIVIDREKAGGKYLAAYIVFRNGEETSKELLRKKIANELPDYMVPNTFTPIAGIPLTINGKLDTRALPDPEFTSGESYQGPRNEMESILCSIWTEVLGKEQVGIHDNFFHIGGDSIVAIRVVAKTKALGLYFSVLDLFSKPTIAGLAAVIEVQKDKEEDYKAFSLLNKEQHDLLKETYTDNLIDAYPATYLQKGMLLESTRDVGVYHDVLTYQIDQPFDQERFSTLVQKLVKRHEALRTGFVEDDSEGYLAFVVEEQSAAFEVILGETPIEELVQRELTQHFDFKKPELFRFIVSNISETNFLFTFSLHHAIIDGWSVASLISELTAAYATGGTDLAKQVQLPSYGEFARNERAAINDPKFDEFWSNYLDGYEAPAVPFVDQVMSNEVKQEFTSQWVSEEDAQFIVDFARQIDVSVDCVFLALYHHVLSLFENTADLTIGLVTNNRLEKEGGDQLVGLFLNTIPFRPKLADGRLEDVNWIQHIAAEKTRVLKYKALPYPYIKAQWMTNATNYQCAFNYIHFHIAENEETESTQKNTPIDEYEKINIPMLLTVSRENKGFLLSLAAHKGSVDAYSFKQFWTYFNDSIHQLIKGQATQAQSPLIQLTNTDLEQLKTWNNTPDAFPMDQTLHALFEAQVSRTPQQIALSCGEEKLTYSELNERANQLANCIQKTVEKQTGQSIQPDTLIALYLERGMEMVISILAVLKSGGAYVPISTDYPKDRVVFLLNDTKTPLVLSGGDQLQDWNAWQTELNHNPLKLAVDQSDLWSNESKLNLKPLSSAEDLAYVIYTSGTTGQPKGVEISHRASSTRNWYMAERSQSAENVYLFKTNYIFDVSVSDLFSHLFVGAHVVVAKAIFDLEEIEGSREKYGVNACHFVPSQFPAIVDSGQFHMKMDRLYFSGESLTKEHIEKIDLSQTKAINYYGPTETGEATSYIVQSAQDQNVIGEPFNGTQIYVLNRHMDLSPIGSPGELYIGGAGLARGYLNQPELTAERFIEHPFPSEAEKAQGFTTLYKTGDLVRWLPSGDLQYLGRIDNQVKIRGHRIELAEIETVLSEMPEVKQAVVVALEKDGNKFLAAYFVPHEEVTVEAETLMEKLAEKLPDYMWPSSLMPLAAIPLTRNGKLNRRELPEPEFVSTEKYVAPETELEIKLCKIWEDVLGLEKIGTQDNFFRLGGNSMTAIRLTSASRKSLGIDISLSLLFDHKTVAGLAAHLDQRELLVIPKASLKKDNPNKQVNKIKL